MRVKPLDFLQTDIKIFDEMLNHTNHLIMGLEKINLFVRIRRVGYQLIQRIAKVQHTIHNTLGIGILDILVLGADKIANTLEFMFGPVHDRMGSDVVIFRHRLYLGR